MRAARASSWQNCGFHGAAATRRNAHRDRVLVNVQARAARIEHVHGFSSFAVRRREEPSLSKSTSRNHEHRCPVVNNSGCSQGSRVQLLNGLEAPNRYRPRPSAAANRTAEQGRSTTGQRHPSASGLSDGELLTVPVRRPDDQNQRIIPTRWPTSTLSSNRIAPHEECLTPCELTNCESGLLVTKTCSTNFKKLQYYFNISTIVQSHCRRYLADY